MRLLPEHRQAWLEEGASMAAWDVERRRGWPTEAEIGDMRLWLAGQDQDPQVVDAIVEGWLTGLRDAGLGPS